MTTWCSDSGAKPPLQLVKSHASSRSLILGRHGCFRSFSVGVVDVAPKFGTTMSDTVNPTERSRIMAAVKSKGTTPEMAVRRLVHSLGFRYRLHVRELPGTPDIVLPRHRKIIEVRGCFWHMHTCGRCRIPATRREWWTTKLKRNRQRDRRTRRQLKRLQWDVLVIWECQTRDSQRLRKRLVDFLRRDP